MEGSKAEVRLEVGQEPAVSCRDGGALMCPVRKAMDLPLWVQLVSVAGGMG